MCNSGLDPADSSSIEDDYTVEIDLDFESENFGEYNCFTNNLCARGRCECDSYFAVNVLVYFNEGESLNSGNLDTGVENCRAGDASGTVNKMCCGEAPIWIWFDTASQSCNDGVVN